MRLLAVAALAVIALTGCSSSVTTAPTPTATAGVASAAPIATPIPSTDATGLSFAQGNQLSSTLTSAPGFLNGFDIANSGWVEAPGTDAASGHWIYTTSDETCTSTLSQIQVDPSMFAIVADDDKASSVNLLKWVYKDAANILAELTTSPTAVTLPYGKDWDVGDPATDVIAVSAVASTGAQFAAYGRVFGVPKVALIAEYTCKDAASFTLHQESSLRAMAISRF